MECSPEFWMQYAIQQAQIAFENDEVPVGAVIVNNNQIIGSGNNLTEHLKDPTAHAEMIAITAACNALQSKYLKRCTLYVTLEPCPMCAAALRWSQISTIYIGAEDTKSGYRQISPQLLHPKTQIFWCENPEIYAQLMIQFFSKKRK